MPQVIFIFFSEMRGKLYLVLTFFECMLSIQAVYIERDGINSPFVFKYYKEIEYETSKTEFAFKINVSIISILRNEHENIRNACISSLYFQPFTNAIFHNMIWNDVLDSNLPRQNIISWKPKNIENLKIAFQIYKNELNKFEKCNHLFLIVEQLYALNYEFDNLRRSNFKTLTNLIPSNILLTYAYNFTVKSKQVSALDFTHWFQHNFFRYSKLGIKVEENSVFVTILIPLYSHAILSKIYAKPILRNNIPYMSNSISQFIIESQVELNYFSSFENNCFYANNRTFCHKLTKENDCDNQYLMKSSNVFNEICFDRQPIKNIVTQIKKDIYFLVLEPMSIDIDCGDLRKTIRMVYSSKILNNKCRVNATFYSFDRNSSRDYGIYFAPMAQNILKLREIDLLIQFYCFLIFFLLYSVFINAILYYYFKMNILKRSLESAV